MKRFSKRTKICSIIFSFLIILIVLISRPVYKKLEKIVEDYTQNLIQQVYDKTGLIISYNSISPSILTYLRIEEILIKDSNNQEIISINKLNIDYNFWSIFSYNFSDFVKGIAIDGVNIDVNKLIKIIEQNQDLFNSEQTNDSDFDIKTILNYVPVTTSISNIYLYYDDQYLNVKYSINEIKIQNSRRKENIEFNIKSRLETLIKPAQMELSGILNLNGTINDNLDNSSISIKLSDFTNGEYKSAKINLLAKYNNNIFDIQTFQNVFPLSVKCEYNLKNNNLALNLHADGFEPLQLISTKNKEVYEYLENIKLFMDFYGTYDINRNEFGYTSKGNVYLPEKIVQIIPDGIVFSYSLFGDDKSIQLTNFDCTGSVGKINGNLKYIFNTMQVEGLLGIKEYKLPNGNIVSSDIYIDPVSDGFMFFAPLIQIGNKTLTAMQSNIHFLQDSIDFDFEVSDYSSLQEKGDGTIGEIKISGNYLNNSNYVQTNVSLNSLSIKSILEYVEQVLPKEQASSIIDLEETLSPYIFTGDLYISSDFKSLSYNVPYILVANAKEGNQYLFASANGNDQNFQLNRFDLILGSYAVSLTGSMQRVIDSNNLFFTLDAVASSIPYHFNGSFINNTISISGDYGIEAQFVMMNNNYSGSLKMDNLPFVISDLSFILAADTEFSFNSENGPNVIVNNLQVEKTDATSTINPKLILSGNGTKYGAQISSITYSDRYSTLSGGGELTININNGIFDSAGFSLSMKNLYNDEKLIFDVSASNPDQVELTSENFLKNIYIDSQLKINRFGLSRFTNVKNDNNELTGSVTFMGTLEHPSVFVTLNKLSMLLNKDLINITGNAILEDTVVSLSNFNFIHPDFKLSGLGGSFDINTFEGKMSGLFSTQNVEKDIEIPLNLEIFDSYFADENDFMPELFSVCLSTDKISGSLMKKNCNFTITATYTPDFISIFSSDNLGLVGTYIPETGEFLGSVDSTDIMYFDFNGTATSQKVDLFFDNIDINLKNLMSYFTIEDFFVVDDANIKGSFNMKGTFDTPDFYGTVYINKPKFSLPSIFKNQISCDKIQVVAEGNVFTLERKIYSLKNEQKFIFDGKIALDKWNVDLVESHLETIKGILTPVNFKSPLINLKGDLSCNMDILYDLQSCKINGKVSAENIDVVLKMTEISDNTTSDSSLEDFVLETNLELLLGTHVNLSFDPLLRCIFVPNTLIKLKVNTALDLYELDGELKLKSGDVNYLSRNFYIKEGSIKFNQEDIANPLISLTAETREKDSNSQNVKIILSVQNQYLKDLSPKFYSEPAKSENEILTLLGQVVIADSENFGEILATAGEYYIQSTVIRDLENQLRDLLNFDIFSFRTNVIQNTIKMSTSGQFNQGDITIGNFLDNSTVYIGKYMGSSLYFDAMLHLSLADGNVNDISFSKGLVFKPEFGIELDLPIANIRWNMAPDIDALLHQRYVPFTTVSLSWKFTF